MDLNFGKLPDSVSVYFNHSGLAWSVFRWAALCTAGLMLVFSVASNRLVTAIVFVFFAAPFLIYYPAVCLWTMLRNRQFSNWLKNRRSYLYLDGESLNLLDTVAIPWTSVSYLRALPVPALRGDYLVVGTTVEMHGRIAAMPGFAQLSQDVGAIRAALGPESINSQERANLLSLRIDSRALSKSPVFLTVAGPTIGELAHRYWTFCLEQAKNAAPKTMPSATPLKPAEVKALVRTAQSAFENGRLDEAEAGFLRVAAADRKHLEAFNMLGIVCAMRGKNAEAETYMRQALAIKENALSHGNLGLLLHETDRLEEAEIFYRKGLKLAPNSVDILGNLGNLLKETNRWPEAETMYRRAIKLNSDFVLAHNNLGIVLWNMRRLPEAIACYNKALSLNPDLFETRSNLGIVLKESMRWPEAEAAFLQVIEQRPDYALAHNNLGILLQERQRYEEAENAFRQALALQADLPEAQFNLSLIYLTQGKFLEGWPGHELRYSALLANAPVKVPDLPFPQWQGGSLKGKSLLICPEQGFGDYIQFARYFPLLKERGLARLTVLCHPVLKALLESVKGVDEVLTDYSDVGAPDCWSFPMSMGMHFNTKLDTIPVAVPYLAAAEERLARWRERLPQRGQESGPKVGLVWKGDAGHKNDANRSLPALSILAPLWEIAQVQYVSLQKGQGEMETAKAAATQPFVSLGPDIADLADTAAIVAQLDLVICVDTAIAHLAGAMGKPCWVLLPAIGCDWRWLIDRTDSPWYPTTTRLFRQAEAGDWSDAVYQVREALRSLVNKSASHQNAITTSG